MVGLHLDKTAYDHPAYKGGAHVVECERCERALVSGEYAWHPIDNTRVAVWRQASPKPAADVKLADSK